MPCASEASPWSRCRISPERADSAKAFPGDRRHTAKYVDIWPHGCIFEANFCAEKRFVVDRHKIDRDTFTTNRSANLSRHGLGDETRKEHPRMLARRETIFLEEIGSEIASWVGTRVALSASGLTVTASHPNGFDMSILVTGNHYVVAFDEWSEEFEDAEEARHIFLAAVEGTARLRVEMLSGRKWRWTLERLAKSGDWIPESTIGHVIWRFWGKASVVCLRNGFVHRG